MLTGSEVKPRSGNLPKRLVIILHGVGVDGENLIDIARVMNRFIPDTYFIAPNAPYPYDYEPDRYYQWFSIMDRSTENVIKGANKAREELDDFIDYQLQRFGLSEKDLVVIGFSQGTMMALHCCLRRKNPVALIVGFSGTLILPELLKTELQSKPDVLLLHGNDDDRIPVQSMHDAYDQLKSHGIKVEKHSYDDIGHSIGEEGFIRAVDTIKEKLKIDN